MEEEKKDDFTVTSTILGDLHLDDSDDEKTPLLAPGVDPVEDIEVQADDEEQTGAGATKTRGRKKIPAQWSRVISLSHDNLDNLLAYDLAPDV